LSTNNNPNHIPLAIRESLHNILTELYYDIPSKFVCITVNHKYQLKRIRISTDIINQEQGWYKFHDLVAKSLTENAGVNDEQDIQEIKYAIDDNHELIYRYSSSENIIKNVKPVTTVVVIDEQELKSKINNNFDGDFINYIIKQIKKTVKCEDVLIRQILYTGLSSYVGDDPINLGIIAPTSEGKTYPVEETMKLFPKEDMYKVGSMSAKVLVRERGILIDKNGEPIDQKIKEWVKKKNLLSDSKEDKEQKLNVLSEIEELYEGAKTLIDLTGKILVFLEPPHKEVWAILKPILSHDSPEIEYPFVNKTDKDGHETKNVVVRGWPSCIFCSAKDESSWPVWPEIKSRCLISSPNMIPKKYKESTKLISKKYGEPNLIQQQTVISDNDIEITKQCLLLIKQKIENLRLKNNNGKISLWIPYAELLEKELPSNKGTDVRLQKRIFSLLRIIPIIKFNLRKLLVLGGEISVIADLQDLKEVLSITQNFDGIPKFKIEFFNNIFYPCFARKTEVDSNGKEGNSRKEEDIIAVTTRELCEFFKSKKGKPISTDNLKKVYVDELINNGIVDYTESKVHGGKQYIYYPIVEPLNFTSNNDEDQQDNDTIPSNESNLETFDQFLQHKSTIYENIITNMTESWIISKIRGLVSYRMALTNFQDEILLVQYLDSQLQQQEEFQLLDSSMIGYDDDITETNRRVTIARFIKDYTKKPISSFDGKQSPNTALFDKTVPNQSNLSKFDSFDEIKQNEDNKVKNFMIVNHLNKVEDSQEKEGGRF
jgi:hypothetical protein